MGVSNVGGDTIMNEQACVASCVRGYHAYRRYGKQLLARSWIAARAQQPIAAHSSGIRFSYGKYRFRLHTKYISIRFISTCWGYFARKRSLGVR